MTLSMPVSAATDRTDSGGSRRPIRRDMPTIASTSPPVLIAHLAASTKRIRIGSARLSRKSRAGRPDLTGEPSD
jgi:alkanesulfonate monooxygenase SsuD/methylene tetrahydromethanopterin reductase-like flavin-dependent oxidoreductase (luciferase family)